MSAPFKYYALCWVTFVFLQLTPSRPWWLSLIVTTGAAIFLNLLLNMLYKDAFHEGTLFTLTELKRKGVELTNYYHNKGANNDHP